MSDTPAHCTQAHQDNDIAKWGGLAGIPGRLLMLVVFSFLAAFGWLAVFLGLAGAVAAVLILIEPNDIAAIGIFALVFFNIIIGWRTFRHPATG